MADGPDRRHEVARKAVRFDLPGTAEVSIRRRIPYATAASGELTLDVYEPPGGGGAGVPAVLFVSGLSDIGAREKLGCRINEMESYISWGRLVAASGMTAVTYTTDRDPAANTRQVLAYLREHGDALGLDAARIGLWSCSGHAPNALTRLAEEKTAVRCAVFCYGLMRDLDLPPEVPIFVARAGRDEMPGFNDAIDGFLAAALRRNLPVTFVNHPTGPHAFDLHDDSPTTRAIVRDILRFLETWLGPPA